MADTKRFYWLKLKDDFFRQKEIKKLRRIAGGDTFTIIYLKMLLRSLKDGGRLYYEGIEDNFASEVALDIDEDEDNVKMTVAFLLANNILTQNQPDEYELLTASEMTGSESDSAARVRRMRANESRSLPAPRTRAKTNAERQKAFRAKQNCEKRHIPLIEDYANTKRYDGNYYLIMQRDRYQCSMCNDTNNLCVHHIDGYNENKPENSAMNRMLVLCRSCHMKVHRSELQIPQDVLDAIGYETDSNVTSNGDVTDGNGAVTACNTEIDIDIESKNKRKREELQLQQEAPATVDTVQAYASSNLQYMSPGNIQDMMAYMDDLPDDLIRYAIDIACGQGKPRWAYVSGILSGFIRDGIRTVGDAKAAKAAWDAKKHPEQKERVYDEVTPENVEESYW